MARPRADEWLETKVNERKNSGDDVVVSLLKHEEVSGIGRSSVIAACALICSGIEAEEALALIRASRGLIVPDTDDQRDWVVAFGNAQGGEVPPG